MIFRKVSLDMVEEAIFTPDASEESHSGRRVSFKRFGEGLLKVV